MKALPKQVKITRYVYDVEYDDKLSEEGLLGKIELLHGKIYIRPGMSPQMEETVLRHEMGHGWLFHNGVQEHDEKHLDLLSTGYMVMQMDNPELAE